MSTRSLNFVLLAAFLASLWLNWISRPQPSRPNREFFPEMVRTPRFNAYAPNPNFPDGKTLQLPVAGTIPHGSMPLHFGPTREDAVRAGETLSSPLQANHPEAIARGAVVFGNFCQPCHGRTGQGDGLVVARGYPAPPSLTADHARGIRDGEMFHILTYGQNNMPAYASQISREDRWKVIAYLRSLPAGSGGQP